MLRQLLLRKNQVSHPGGIMLIRPLRRQMHPGLAAHITNLYGNWVPSLCLQVSDIAEVYHLSKLPDLQVLSLAENPVASEPDYRLKVRAAMRQAGSALVSALNEAIRTHGRCRLTFCGYQNATQRSHLLSQVLAYLPRLQKLDDVLVTPDEVEEAQAR